MTDKELENLADEARLLGENDLAIVLYTYLGSKHASVSNEFAKYCQTFAREGAKKIETRFNKRNN